MKSLHVCISRDILGTWAIWNLYDLAGFRGLYLAGSLKSFLTIRNSLGHASLLALG